MGSRVYYTCPECGAEALESDNGEIAFSCNCLNKFRPMYDEDTVPTAEDVD